MPEQFVNPPHNMEAGSLISFDFPCVDMPPSGIGVEQPSQAVGSDTYVAYCDDHRIFGNVNLKAPAIERLYGKLGNPKREQGHPFMKEYDDTEPEDPTANVHHDQIVDIDRGIQINHTGRLSGDFSPYFASKPFFSTITISAVAVAPVTPSTASIQLQSFKNWLEPQAEGPNVWYWRKGDPSTEELMFTSDVRIADPQTLGFEAEALYKLVYRWKFWKYTATPYPDTPPDPQAGDVIRLGISGFDEAIAFEVSGETHVL
jgi:hypothetical protein